MKIAGDENNEFILRELGQRIKEIRIRRSMTQKELARNAGVSFSTVVRIENGEGVNIENLMKIMRILELLKNFNILIPEQLPTPEELFKDKPKRQRVSKTKGASRQEWKWGDEE